MSRHGWEPAIALALSLSVVRTTLGEDVSMVRVGQWGGCTYEVEMDGPHTVWLGVGPRMVILDVADPAHPRFVGQTPPTDFIANGFARAGRNACVAAGDLWIFDVGDPAVPHTVGRLEFPGSSEVRAVAVDGQYAFLADYYLGLRVVDISDPNHPVQIGYWQAASPSEKLAYRAPYVFLASWYSLDVIDVSTPTAPRLAGTYAYAPDNVTIQGSYAYVACYETLRILDISSPATPVQVGVLQIPNWRCCDVKVDGSRAYAVEYGGGLSVVDVADPARPALLGSTTTGWSQAVAVSGNNVYVSDWLTGMRAVDVSNPNAPVGIGLFDHVAHVRQVAVANGYAYLTGYGPRVQIIDARDPANPWLVGSYSGGVLGYDRVAIVGQFAFAVGDSVLDVLDVANPAAPSQTGRCTLDDYPLDVVVRDGLAYIADFHVGLAIVDVSNPAQPHAIANCSTNGVAYGIAVQGDYAYVADADTGLVIIDVSSPASPIWVGAAEAPGSARGVKVHGRYAYVAAASGGLAIYDVQVPSRPVLIANFNHGRYYVGIANSGDYAYVADSGVCMVNISDPAHPTGAFSTRASGWPEGLEISGGYLYLADTEAGLSIYAVYIRGDLNCDGRIDFADINPFVLALSHPDAYRAQFPECHLENADLNHDRAVDFNDINPFVAVLAAR